MKRTFHVPARELAEFCCRRGDLKRGNFSASALQTGIKAHRKVQQSRGENYQAEVSVSRLIQRSDYDILVAGRIDGLYNDRNRFRLEEIKSVRVSPDDPEGDTYQVHWAQLKVYGAIFAHLKKLERLDLQLTYYRVDNGTTREFIKTCTTSELELAFEKMIAFYIDWLERILLHLSNRTEALHKLTFPFKKYRPGQFALMHEIDTTISSGGQLLVEAPTGLGKTMAAIFPAIKSLADSRADKIFFLTARTPGRKTAESSLSALKFRDRHALKWLSLTAREKICFQTAKPCIAEQCEYARGFYERIKSALDACYSSDAYTQAFIEKQARLYRVCPFELSLELALFSDVIICDYNYVFDPRVYLRRFFMRKNLLEVGKRYIFLVDEAHNLPERARGMYSARLEKRLFPELKRTLGKTWPALGKAAGEVNGWFLKSKKELEYSGSNGVQQELPSEILPILQRFLKHCEHYFIDTAGGEYSDLAYRLYTEVQRFMFVAESYDGHYATCFEKNQRGLAVSLFCIDPSEQLQTCIARAGSSVFLSATLSPADYFRRLLGCPPSAGVLSLTSPYPADHLCVLQMEGLSVRYRHRRDTAARVVAALSAFIAARKGNYLIYFPSYAYLESVRAEVQRLHPDLTLQVQTPEMTEASRRKFLDKFKSPGGQTLVGLAVMGGIFGESIDLGGECLTGVGIIGVGLPAITVSRELIKYYFNEGGNGYEFAYLYPGLSRVVQAAGRLIRSEEDRGALLLIDDRFTSDCYAELLPEGWKIQTVWDVQMLRKTLEVFWRE